MHVVRIDSKHSVQSAARQIQERKEQELSAFKALLDDALRWKQSIILREYIEAMKAKQSENPGGNISDDWIRWA